MKDREKGETNWNFETERNRKKKLVGKFRMGTIGGKETQNKVREIKNAKRMFNRKVE